MNTKNIHKKLISSNIYALYEGGDFSTTENLRDGWIMLIDIGRYRHTIMTNSKTTDALEFCGQLWEKHSVPYEGTYMVIDDDWMVHQSVAVTEEDFINVKEGLYGGIMEMTSRTYMNEKEEFKRIK